jgi:uncharacterized membrane protein
MHSFSITEALSFGFRMFIRNFWLLMGLSIAGAAIQAGATLLSTFIIKRSGLVACELLENKSKVTPPIETSVASNDLTSSAYNQMKEVYQGFADCFNSKNILPTLIVLIVNLLATIFGFILLMGWNRIALDLYDRGTSEFSRIFVTLPLFITYLIAGLLYGAIVTVGLLLLIIPGIVWCIKYSFFDLMIVDTGCGPIEALTKSGELTYGNKWHLLLFAIIAMALMVVSIPTLIGPFILTYVLFLSRAYIFRKLQGAQQHHVQ